MHGLNPYINEGLESHDISILDKATLKEKVVEEKIKRPPQRSFEKIHKRNKTLLATYQERK